MVSWDEPDFKNFLTYIKQYSNSFQVISIGATKDIQENCMPTLMSQRKIYHLTASLLHLATPDSGLKFLHIFFLVIQLDKSINIMQTTIRWNDEL